MPELELSLCAKLALKLAGHDQPYFYSYSENRWWFVSEGNEFFLFDDVEGVRIVDNPF